MTKSSCVPISQMAPRSITTMRSARRTVESRWAMTTTVRPAIRLAKRPLHQHFRFRIEFGGRLIQNQNGRILQQRPGDGDSLALPSREPLAAFADHGLVALRHFLNEFLASATRAASRTCVSVGQAAAVTNIVVDRVVKENRFLRDDADLGAQRLKLNVANVVAVNAIGPG